MTAQFEGRPERTLNFARARAREMAQRPSRLSRFRRYYFARPLVRTINFLTDQAKETIGRPSRVLYVPLRYFNRMLSWLRRILRIPPLTAGGAMNDEALRLRRIDRRFIAGNRCLQEDRPLEAWKHYESCIQESKEWIHFFVAAVGLFHGLGRHRESMSLFAHANELRANKARELGSADYRYRVLDNFWAGSFGHLAVLDYVVKLGILEGRSRDDTILFVPRESSVANRCLLEQWRPHLKLVEQGSDLPFPAGAGEALRFDYLGPRLEDGSTGFFWELAAKTYRRWYSDKRPPLLALAPDIEERGRRALRSKGIPDDAWFVGMHVREAGSKSHHDALHQILNADVMSYLPAIAEITKRGGWVIRMGDPSMAPLPSMPNVLDYCHSDLRADWMDVFITARCRFFLGSSSGPAYLPPLYGVPAVLSNWWPPAQRPWHPTDIFIPKLVRRANDGRLLTLSETLTEPVSYCHSLYCLQSVEKVCVEDNAPEDIRGAVVEMFDRLEGMVCSDADARLRERVDHIYDAAGAFGMGQLARDFVNRHISFVN